MKAKSKLSNRKPGSGCAGWFESSRPEWFEILSERGIMASKTQYVVRGGRVRALKEGVVLAEYLAKYPDAQACKGQPPSMAMLERWVSDGVAKATDGCRVEPDGECPHGHKSWLLVLGWI